MKKWTLHYNGEMIHQSTKQSFTVTLQVNISEQHLKCVHQIRLKINDEKLEKYNLSNFRLSTKVNYRILTLIPIWILGHLQEPLQKKIGQEIILLKYVGNKDV